MGRDQLLYAFDAVVHVDVLDSQDAANLELLGRPELGLTFTKLQCWRLTQYSKCVFMDADTLVSSLLTYFLVHGQVTIIFVVSVCLSVCLFVCAEFFSAVFDPIWIKLGHMLHVRV